MSGLGLVHFSQSWSPEFSLDFFCFILPCAPIVGGENVLIALQKQGIGREL